MERGAIPVFFRPETVADAASYSPSAGKPPQVVADWQRHALPVEIRSFDPVDEATLALAHDAAYVRGVLACTLVNGFGNRRPDVAASLPFTNGAMLAAAREAVANQRVACAPVSGFHHACRGHADGSCTFNALNGTASSSRRLQGSGCPWHGTSPAGTSWMPKAGSRRCSRFIAGRCRPA